VAVLVVFPIVAMPPRMEDPTSTERPLPVAKLRPQRYGLGRPKTQWMMMMMMMIIIIIIIHMDYIGLSFDGQNPGFNSPIFGYTHLKKKK